MAKSTRSSLVRSGHKKAADPVESPRDALMRKLWMQSDLLQYRLRELHSHEFTTSSVVRGRTLEKVKQQEIEDILRAISRDIGALVSLRR